MEAVVLRQYGGFERLRLEEVPLPEVGAGEIGGCGRSSPQITRSPTRPRPTG